MLHTPSPYNMPVRTEMGELPRVGQESTPRAQHVLRSRAAPLQSDRALVRASVLPVLGFLHHVHLRTGDVNRSLKNIRCGGLMLWSEWYCRAAQTLRMFGMQPLTNPQHRSVFLTCSTSLIQATEHRLMPGGKTPHYGLFSTCALQTIYPAGFGSSPTALSRQTTTTRRFATAAAPIPIRR